LREVAKHLDPASGEAVIAAILDDTLSSAVATRVCRTELWSLSDAWRGLFPFHDSIDRVVSLSEDGGTLLVEAESADGDLCMLESPGAEK
jgi:hypothetical protein